jgi:HAD superfamily hydrolase (TIGR01509 family)
MDALIFDMDGVIVDSELHWKSVEGFFLQSLVPTWTSADQGKIIGLSVRGLYDMLAGEYGLKETRERFEALYEEMASDIYMRKVSLMDGFMELLTGLNGQSLPVALSSSSPTSWIDMVVGRFDLRPHFKAIVSADELDGEGKPSPAIYLFTAEKLGVDPRSCVAIEDSKNGVVSAKRAGMFCIGFRNGFNEEQDLSTADMIIHSLSELDYPTLRRLLLVERVECSIPITKTGSPSPFL